MTSFPKLNYIGVAFVVFSVLVYRSESRRLMFVSFSKGISRRTLPYKRSVPSWLKMSSDDVCTAGSLIYVASGPFVVCISLYSTHLTGVIIFLM